MRNIFTLLFVIASGICAYNATAVSTQINITGEQIANTHAEMEKCLTNKLTTSANEKAEIIKARSEFAKSPETISGYDLSCTPEDRNIIFSLRECMLKACDQVPADAELIKIIMAARKACSHIPTNQTSPGCIKVLLGKK